MFSFQRDLELSLCDTLKGNAPLTAIIIHLSISRPHKGMLLLFLNSQEVGFGHLNAYVFQILNFTLRISFQNTCDGIFMFDKLPKPTKTWRIHEVTCHNKGNTHTFHSCLWCKNQRSSSNSFLTFWIKCQYVSIWLWSRKTFLS